jgi:hypothetical protein
VVKKPSLVQVYTPKKVFGGKVLEDPKTFVFQLMGTEDLYEVQAEDSAEAFRRCLREKNWPIERVAYKGLKGND